MEKRRLDFLVVGAAKAGTTTLHDLLCQHSKVCLPKMKETHFFDIQANYNRGIEYYFSFFRNCIIGHSVIGEITPSYMFVDGVARRIYETMGGEVKLIFILRHPVKRAYSHFNFNVARGIENLQFERAIELENDRIQISPKYNRRYSYMSRGFYHKQVLEYLKYFDKAQMHFIIFEEFIENKADSLKDLLRFLNLDDEIVDLNIRSNYTANPKSYIISNLINGNNVFKRIVKIFLNPRARRLFRNSLRDLNLGSQLNKNELNSETVKILTDKYFSQDIISMEEIIGRKITKWHT
jgi:hypothetical protein